MAFNIGKLVLCDSAFQKDERVLIKGVELMIFKQLCVVECDFLIDKNWSLIKS